jgi:rhodanese-related sulfurtransferase
LQEMGFSRVYNVKEGMAGSGAGPGWVRRGLPVERCQTC